jgi:hypothetical protein
MTVNLHALQQHALQFLRRKMKRRPSARTAAVILLPLVVAAVGYWGYGEHKKRELPKTVSALVHNASQRLEDALSSDGEATGASPEAAHRLDQHLVAVDRHLLRLRGMDATTIEEFANAADDYLLTAREILRRRASDHHYRMQLSESTQALRHHMRSDNRTGAWITQAVQTKEQVAADYRDYRLTTEALAKLLGLFSASRAKLAPHVDHRLLADENVVAAARSRALEAFRQITDEVERTGQLNAYR